MLGTFGHGNDTTASDNAKVQAVIDETKWEKEDSPNAQATKVSVDRLYNELLKSMGNTDLEEGQRTMTAALKASGSSATADDPAFKAAMVQGYREQMARTEAIARGEQPKPSPTAADSTTRIGQALGGSLAGRAMADARKGLLRDMKKQVKLEKIGDMLDAGAGAIAEVAKTLRGDAEKANAEAVAAAQRGASEMDSRIRSNYMQAQGMINQMAHVLRIGRSTH